MTTQGWAEDAPGTSWSADETQGLTEAHKGSTVQDDWRAALAEALGQHGMAAFCGTDAACRCDHRWRPVVEFQAHQTDALLPTLRRIVAAELRAAAAELHVDPLLRSANFASYVTHKIRARADELDATPDHGKA